MVGIKRVLRDRKNGHFGVKLIILCDIFFNLILMDIRKWTIYNVGMSFLKQWTSMETLGRGSSPKGKQPRNSLPKVSSTSWHFATSNPLSSFPTTSFVKIFSFFSTSIFSFLNFCWARATKPLEVRECVVWAPSKFLLQFVLFNLQEFDKLIPFNDDIMQCFVLHVFHKKTFLNQCWHKFIVDLVY